MGSPTDTKVYDARPSRFAVTEDPAIDRQDFPVEICMSLKLGAHTDDRKHRYFSDTGRSHRNPPRNRTVGPWIRNIPMASLTCKSKSSALAVKTKGKFP